MSASLFDVEGPQDSPHHHHEETLVTTDPCPVPGCPRSRPTGKAMCAPCWRRVPRYLQSALYAAWRSWRADLGDGNKLRTYRHALDRCIEAAG